MDALIMTVGLALSLLGFWLMFYLLNTRFERKPRFKSKFVVVIALVVMYVLYALVTGPEWFDSSELIDNLIALAFISAYLFAYALLCLKGPAMQKLFWVGLAVVFYILGNQVVIMIFVMLDVSTRVSSDVSMLAMLQITFVAVIIQGAATFIVARKQSIATKISPLSLVLLILIPLISAAIITLVSSFGASNYGLTGIAELEFFVSIGLVIITFATFALYNYTSRVNAKNLEQQKELQKAELERVYHAEIQMLYQETRTWRHDFRNHVQAITAFFEMKNYEALGNYLDKISQSTERIEMRVNSGNKLLDAIVNTKITLAEENGVRLNADMALQSDLPIDSVDLTTLVGNLLDNAIEASMKVVAREAAGAEASGVAAYVDLSISDRVGNQLLMSVENSTAEAPVLKDGRFLSSKTKGDHGIGMGQIDSVVEKYDGFITRKAEDGVFSTYVRIPLP